jgi:oligosaccharyltransferase complex subunit alpha (ribophorin I)
VTFNDAVKPGEKFKFEVSIVFTQLLTPHPEYILQSEQQLVVYEGSAHILSLYEIKDQKTTVQLSPGSVESFTKVQPAKQEGTTIVYGPYASLPPFSKAEMKIHYENNSPFLTITEFSRVIEVSHWGNIAVEETLDVYHSGARLKGSFSRFDFQRDNRPHSPAVKSWKTYLPAAAADVYYRDEIGNISTSNLRVREEAVELDIRPRFPLFGGWKTHYTIGYNIPSYEYLFSSGSQYDLKMRCIDHIFDNFVVEKFTLKVILPEGSK